MWNDLTMQQRADIISMAVKAGIRDMNSIRSFYDESVGSRRFDDGGRKNTPRTTGGAGYVPPAQSPAQSIPNLFYENTSLLDGYNIGEFVKNLFGLSDKTTREDMLEHLNWKIKSMEKDGYNDSEGGREILKHVKNQRHGVYTSDEVYAQYLGIPISERHTDIRLPKDKYQKGAYSLPISKMDWDKIIYETNNLGLGKNKSSDILKDYGLGVSTFGRGYDERGEYRSYGDRVDLNPFRGRYAIKDVPIINKVDDISFGIFHPYDIYDRIYLDDYYGVKEPTHSTYLPEITVIGNKKSNGGSIHIAPSKRGTFTAAATKHGMGVQEFASKVLAHPENYSLTMRKKANFARNASKWKH